MLNLFLDNYSSTQIAILRHIRSHVRITRAALTEISGFKLLTVTKTVARLLDDGLILEIGYEQSTGGRKAAQLSINPHFRYTLAVDIGAYCARVGVVGMDGSVIEYKTYRGAKTTYPSQHMSVEELRGILAELIQKYGKEKILGIGIGISGIVHNSRGRVLFCPNIAGWNNVDVKAEFTDYLGVDVVVDTAARCMALAEHTMGIGRNIANQVFVSIGSSVSAGIILAGQLYRGADETAGEIGHINVRQNSTQRCTCGNTGCMELYATLPTVLTQARDALDDFSGFSPLRSMVPEHRRPTPEIMREAVRLGDRIAMDVLSGCANTIATSIIYLTNILNPELVILGGGLIECFPELAEEVERLVKRHCFTATQQNLSIRAGTLGSTSAMVGSALQVLDKAL